MGCCKPIYLFMAVAFVLPASNAGDPGCPFGHDKSDAAGDPLPDYDDPPTVADPETTTPNGCTCKSLCGATFEDLYTLDWCYTEGDCGRYNVIHGYWDHCLYKDS